MGGAYFGEVCGFVGVNAGDFQTAGGSCEEEQFAGGADCASPVAVLDVAGLQGLSMT